MVYRGRKEFLCLEMNLSRLRIIRYQNKVSQGVEASQDLYNQKENEEHKVVKTVDLHVLYILSVRDEGKVRLAAGARFKYAVILRQNFEIMCRVICDGSRIEIMCTASCMSVTSVTLYVRSCHRLFILTSCVSEVTSKRYIF